MDVKKALSSIYSRKRVSIVNAAQMITVFVIALFACSLITLVLISKYLEQKQRAQSMRVAHVERQKDITRREVERVVASIQQRRANCHEDAMAIAKQRVYQAHSIAENIYRTCHEKKSRQEIQKIILRALGPVRFDRGSGYYFVDTLDGKVLILPGRPDLQGRHYSTFESEQEQAVVASRIKLAKRQQEGGLECQWTMPGKPGSDHHVISYVKLFEPYNLVIGTGLYLDALETELKQELKEEISRIKYGVNGYFFINDMHGNILAHGLQPELVGASNWDYTDSRGNKLFQDLNRVVQDPEGGFCAYWWELPETGEERPKIAFAMAVPGWEWLIGTGLYLDEVNADVREMQAKLRAQSIHEVVLILLVTIVIIILVYMLMGFLFRDLRRDIAFFNESLTLAAEQDVSIDEEKIKFTELMKMAGNANRMLREKAQLLKKLGSDKKQLFITLQSITDAVIATNQEHEIVLLNTVAERLINCSREDAFYKPLPEALSFFDERTKTQYDFPIQPSLVDICSITLPEHIHLISKSGRKYNVEIVASPITNQEGGNQGIIVVLRDITEKLKSEQERLRLKKLESVGVLAGGIAHDFNNMLAGLMGNLELAKTHIKPVHQAYKYITEAEYAMNDARSLATQLLTFAKGGEPIKRIISLKKELVLSAEFSLRGSKVQLETDIADDLYSVEADLGQLNQVMSNLIINAKQAMPDGGKVTLRAENEEEKWIKITITDQGPGIPEDIQEKIFDPYFTTKTQGSGLGLATCYAIIRKHGGTIMVESELGKGTSFTIRLPATDKSASVHPGSNKKESTSSPENRDARILVVDDMEMLRTLLKRILTQAGYEVEEAGDGTEALEKYAQAINDQKSFDLVITDLTIPGGKGGQEILKSLLEMDPEARVIVASGYSSSPVMAHYKEYGFAACIAKPYCVADVREMVRQVLQNDRQG